MNEQGVLEVAVSKLFIRAGVSTIIALVLPSIGNADELSNEENRLAQEHWGAHPDTIEPKEVEKVEPDTKKEEPKAKPEPVEPEQAEVLQEPEEPEQERQEVREPEQVEQPKPLEDDDDKDVVPANDSVNNNSVGSFQVTYYTAFCDSGCTGVTATGLDVSSTTTHNGHGIIATDPNVIPMGTVVEFGGSTYIAQDTGGNIKGNRIDILVSSKEQAINAGRHDVNVTIQ